MSLRKVNMVTKKDMTDLWQCTECGKKYVSRHLGDRPVECNSKKCNPNRMPLKPKVSKDTVYGCWGCQKSESICGHCNAKLIIVPRDGHPNSKFWALERDDGMVLKCCPAGCLE